VDARTLPDLIVFLQVVRSGSLTAAAVRLRTVQSNVTARIKNLERAAGTPLLERHARGVKPTAAGEAALALALRAAALLQDFRATFGQALAPEIVKLRLGAIETVAASQLPEVVGQFARRHPHVDLSVQTGSSSSLTAQLKQGELDAVFVSRAANLPGFRQRVAFRDELVVIAAPGVSSLSKLVAAGAPLKVLVQRLGCSYSERLLAYLKDHSSPQPRVLEVGTLEAIVGFVAAGMGIAVMPRGFLASLGARKRGKTAIRSFVLPGTLRQLETHLMAPASADAGAATNAFVSLFGL
jgi:DNA-binding transcriptional LysR family regulator